jgi:hypothetical protein
MTTNHDQSTAAVEPSGNSRVEGRDIVSAPGRTIQVERVRVSDLQRSSIASAFRAGRATAARAK